MHTSKLLVTRLLLAAVLLSSAVAQTLTPSLSPSMMPVDVTQAPSTSPTVDETESPSVGSTTISPTVTPNEPSQSPTNVPTADDGTGAPSTVPTVTPMTESPTMGTPLTSSPSSTPSTGPTMMDVEPSAVPTSAPSASFAPSVLMGLPSAEPTGMPSSMPSVASEAPSSMPTGNETQSPTSAAPTQTPITESISGLKISLVGVTRVFNSADQMLWQNATALYIEDFYNSRRRRLLRRLQATDVSNVETTLSVSDTQLVPAESGPSSLEVTYDQEITYTSDSDDLIDGLVTEPFSSQPNQQIYAADLRAAGNAAGNDIFDTLVTTSGVTVPEEDSGDSGLSTGAIIGIACGGAAGLLLLGGGAMYLKNRQSKGAAGGAGYLKSDSDDVPPQSLQLSGARGDEVSTLGDPKTKSGVASGDEFTGYGDQSVATVDYDYSKAYGGAGESVSSAGGTFGSNTHGQASMAAGIGAGAALAAGAAGYSDDDSFDAQYRGDQKEEMIDVYAPAGKLGVVIDTPDDGPPVVHAIKDSSVIADKLQVGDMLVSVDDEDVRSMTAIKVSKLISRKSGNATRKLTVIRRSAGD